MAGFSGSGGTYSTSTVTVSPTTTATVTNLPDYTVMLILRTPTTNTANVYIQIRTTDDTKQVTSGDLLIRAGESITIDFSTMLLLKRALGNILYRENYPRRITYVAASGTQTLYIDAIPIL